MSHLCRSDLAIHKANRMFYDWRGDIVSLRKGESEGGRKDPFGSRSKGINYL
jgi:hypothetical protein